MKRIKNLLDALALCALFLYRCNGSGSGGGSSPKADRRRRVCR